MTTTPSTETLLKFSRVQLAAEAINLANGLTGAALSDALVNGNSRSSKFVRADADAFAAEWEVVKHKPNTSTGFSGTLFKRKGTNELVLSFRSTEFADDAARDNQATNTLEVAQHGWAFGQIADMQEWVNSLAGDIPIGAPLTVTGYSLGGHLATAYDLLYSNPAGQFHAGQIITFNGAGVGEVIGGEAHLGEVISAFNARRKSGPDNPNQDLFSDPTARALYTKYAAIFTGSISGTAAVVSATAVAAYDEVLLELLATPSVPESPEPVQQLLLLLNAVGRIKSIADIVASVNSVIPSGTGAPSAGVVMANKVEQLGLDYQLAVAEAGKLTKSYESGLVFGAKNAVLGRNTKSPKLNRYDVFGSIFQALDYSAVANSQWHHGTAIPVWIEDQPLARGNVLVEVAKASWNAWEKRLLVSEFSKNDFGDTHSLILMVDSLAVQRRLTDLMPEIDQQALTGILNAASKARGDSVWNDQGLADGDSLELVVEALASALGMTGLKLKGNPNGNTWHLTVDDPTDPYSTRTDFYQRLKGIDEVVTSRQLAGKVLIHPSGPTLRHAARREFGAIVALQDLAPFWLESKQGTTELKTHWENARADSYAAWRQETDGMVRVGAHFSDNWLTDRAALLDAITRRNTSNTQVDRVTGIHNFGAYQFQYVDPSDYATKELEVIGRITNIPLTRVVFGSDGADPELTGTNSLIGDRMYGGGGNDHLSGLQGNDYLEGNEGDDVLVGGAGIDTLMGGTGTDEYHFEAFDEDTILDADGLGHLKFGNEVLRGGELTPSGLWKETTASGKVIAYKVVDDPRSSTKKSLIVFEEGMPTASVTVKDFDLERAKTTKYLGLELKSTQKLAVRQGNGPNPWKDPGFLIESLIGSGSPLLMGAGVVLTIYLKVVANAGEKVVLHLQGIANQLVKAIRGDDTVDADGAEFDLQPGQTEIKLALVTSGELSQNIIDGLTATFHGEGVTATSNSWQLGLQANNQEATIFLGDQRPELNESGAFDWGATTRLPDGTLSGGVGEAGFADVLYGTAQADELKGLGGNDALNGGAGADKIDGGEGDDLIAGGVGTDTIKGGAGNDMILTATNLNASQRSRPDDEVDLPAGATVFSSGPTWAVYSTSPASYMVYGGESMTQDTDGDIADGGAGNDRIIGGRGADRLSGGADNDVVTGHEGADVLEGNDGNDYLFGDGRLAPWYYDTTDPMAHGADFLDGGAGADTLVGGGNADALYGGAGDDALYGDQLASESGDLPAAFHGDDYLAGEDGDDFLVGQGGADTLLGGSGADFLAGDDTALNLAGEHHGDDQLDGGLGDDTLVGGGGSDTLVGGDGNDRLNGDAIQAELDAMFGGRDSLYGGNGDDILVGGADADALYGGAGADTLVGDGEDIAESFHRDDYLDGGDEDDVILGGGGDDRALGGTGNDWIEGGAGNDLLLGGEGNDNLLGGEGNDRLEGGAGQDVLRGEGGDDVYVLNPAAGTSGVRILDASGRNRLIVGADLGSIQMGRAEELLELPPDLAPGSVYLTANANSVLIDGALLGSGVQEVEFSDGQVLSMWELIGQKLLSPLNANDGGSGGHLAGGAADDSLSSFAGHAHVSGGRGNDNISVGTSGNTLHYAVGDGLDRLQRLWTYEMEDNVLELGAGLSFENVRLAMDPLGEVRIEIDTMNGVDEGFILGTPDELWEAPLISEIRAEDGTLTWDTLLEWGIYVGGSEGDDTLYGTEFNDVLVGGSGSNWMSGGYGDDVYQVSAQSANQVLDRDGENMILFSDYRISQDVLSVEQVEASSGTLRISMADGTTVDVIDALIQEADISVWLDDAAPVSVRQLFLEGVGAAGASITGKDTDDHILGGAGADHLVGDSGSDHLEGGAGDDDLDGGLDSDTLLGGAGNDVLAGGSGYDQLTGGEGNDMLSGGEDDDILADAEGDDTLDGGAGGDVYQLAGSTGTKTIIDAEGYDTLELGWALDDIEVGNGDLLTNRVTGQQLHLQGWDPGAEFAASPIETFVVQQPGDSWMSYLSAQQFAAQLKASFLGTEDADVFAGTAFRDTIDAGAGDDVVRGRWGHDILRGGAGNDLLEGGEGNDLLDAGSGNDILAGGEGEDRYVVSQESGNAYILDLAGANVLQFGPGLDASALAVSRPAGTDDLVLSFDGGPTTYISGGMAKSISHFVFADGTPMFYAELLERLSAEPMELVGDDADNELVGASGADSLQGNYGNDTLWGHGGDDTLSGGANDDVLIGGAGNDLMRGGDGMDRYRLARGAGQDRIDDVEGELELQFGPGVGVQDLVCTRFVQDGESWLEIAYGQGDSVTIRQGAELPDLRVYLNGGIVLNRQELFAVALNEQATVQGTAGDEVLYGFAGADTLAGGAGQDTLRGGRGVDTYVMQSGGGTDLVQDRDGGTNVVRSLVASPQDLAYARRGSDLLLLDEANATTMRIEGFFGDTAAWQLQLADGSLADLRSVVRADAAAREAVSHRKEAFFQRMLATDPLDLYGHPITGTSPVQWTDANGDEYVVTHQVVRQAIAAGTEPVYAEGTNSIDFVDYEVLRTEEHSVTHTFEVTTYNTQTTTHPPESYTVGEIGPEGFRPVGQTQAYGSFGLPGEAIVLENGTVVVMKPPRTTTTVTASTHWETVTDTWVTTDERYTYDSTRVIADVSGDGADNYILLGGSSAIATGGAGSDTIERTDGYPDDDIDSVAPLGDFVDGGDGDDILRMGAGEDELSGGNGSDVLEGGAGGDVYFAAADDDGWDVIIDRALARVNVSMHLESYGGVSFAPFASAFTELTGAEVENVQNRFADGTGTFDLTRANIARYRDLRADIEQQKQLWEERGIPGWDEGHFSGYLNSAQRLTQELDRMAREGRDFASDEEVFASLGGAVDVVRFGAGVDPANLTVTHTTITDSDGSLIPGLSISWGGVGGVRVALDPAQAGAGYGIERFEFSDGTSLTRAQMLALAQPEIVEEEPLLAQGGEDAMASLLRAEAPAEQLAVAPAGGSADGAFMQSSAVASAFTLPHAFDLLNFGPGLHADPSGLMGQGHSLDLGVLLRSGGYGSYFGGQHLAGPFQPSEGGPLVSGQVQLLLEAMAMFAPSPAGQTTLATGHATQMESVMAVAWQTMV